MRDAVCRRFQPADDLFVEVVNCECEVRVGGLNAAEADDSAIVEAVRIGAVSRPGNWLRASRHDAVDHRRVITLLL